MSLSTTINRVNYTGNGVTTVFAFPYLVYLDTHLKVYLDGVLQTTGYTVSAIPAEGANPNVTFSVAPANGVLVTLIREVPDTQLALYTVSGAFPAKTTEKNFDLAAMRDQKVADTLGRTLKQPITDTVAIADLPAKDDRASQLLGFDADGDPIAAAAGTPPAVLVSAFMETVLDDANAATAAATLAVLPLAGGVLTGNLLTNSSIISTKPAITGYTRITPNFCKPILPITAAYTPAASCTGHVLDANLPTNTLVLVKVYWRALSNNATGARTGSTTFSGSSDSCAVVTATTTFSSYEQAAVGAGTVLASGTDIFLNTTNAGTIYSTDANTGGNGTSEIYQLEVLGYFD